MDIRVEGLTVRHVGRRAPALQDVSLRWGAGERILLLGPSGSGKSTLALCLNGVVPHSLEAHWEGGRVLVGGRDTRHTSLGDLTRDVGVLFQDPEAQLVMLEVDDEIAFGLENLGTPRHEMLQRVRAARDAVGLHPQRTPRRLDQLSGGAKQRVTLASLLAMGSRALVMDEPTANLDPAGARQVLRLLQDATAPADSGGGGSQPAQRSLLLIEHRLDDVAGLIDRVVVLDGDGRLALEGPPAHVFGAAAARLDALGVWTPQLAGIARLFDPLPATLPATPAAAAGLLVERWPSVTPSSAGAFREVPPGDPHPGARHPQGWTPGGAPLLGLRGAGYRYRGGADAAVQDVSLDIGAGEFLALVGANAAGKSTLGLLLAGIVRPTSGEVTLGGRDLHSYAEREIRHRLSYVFQYPEHQFAAPTVHEDVLYGLRRLAPRGAIDMAELARRADGVLQRFGLHALAEASPYLLSHGQKRRLSVATALVTQPEVIILDEPTFGQDRRHTDELLAFLSALHGEGRTVVLITHDMTLVAERVQRAVAIAAGRVVFDGTPGALFGRPDVLRHCGLRPPPVAEAIALARSARPDIPAAISLPELGRALLQAGAALMPG